MTAKSKSAKYYASHPEARAKKKNYDSLFERKEEQVEKRKELVKAHRERGDYGHAGGYDLAHTSKGLVRKKASLNRGDKDDRPGDRRARGGKKK